MNKKSKTSANGVKKKLMGAVCMLLVASIMMISATYAWFTLSTAPEVTGITTSVGANGSLEMALLNSETWDALGEIKSNVGDSIAATNNVATSNITWGNLVDLSKDDIYGTNHFKLNPAALAVTVANKVNMAAPLATPTYGADGRVDKLENNTVFGTYSNEKEAFLASKTGYGVRAVGVAAGMTDEEIAMRNAQIQVAVQTELARTTMQNALNKNGSALATMAAGYANATVENPYELGTNDITAVNNVITAAKQAKDNLKVAIQNALRALDLSEHNDVLNKEVNDTNYPVPTDVSGITNDAIKAAVGAYNAITVPNALGEGADSEQAKAVLRALLDTDNLTLNDIPISGVKDKMNDLVNSVVGGKGLTLTMTAVNTGTIAKIADMAGNITANVQVTVKYGGFSLDNKPATMKTSAGTAKMRTVATTVAALTAMAPAAGATVATPTITDVYGYAVDLAFRTNASSSYLKLQTEEAQRIYGDSLDASTQGKGSYMDLSPNGLTNKQFKSLAGAIRVLFLGSDGTIIAAAGLNTTKIDVAGDAANNVANAAKLPLEIKALTLDNNAITTVDDNAPGKIMDLNQGVPTKLTVMVYLDGNDVHNDDVAATAADLSSLSGSMNLQFASSADLVPMDYTPLHSNKREETGTP